LEYLQQLWDEVLVEDAKRSQTVRSKHREIPPEDNRDCQPSKKAKKKQLARYHEDNRVKMGGANLCENCVHTKQDCLVHNSR